MATPRSVGSEYTAYQSLKRWLPAVLATTSLGNAALAQQPPPAPTPAAPAQPTPAAAAPEVKRFSFKFRDEQWSTVFDWFEEKSGLMILSSETPAGTISLTIDNKTIPEIVDLLNEALVPVQRVVVRGQQSFGVFAADKAVPAERIHQVDLKDLPNYGRTEIVRVRIPVTPGTAAELVPELAKFVGQFGEVLPLGGNAVVVTGKVAVVQQIAAGIAGMAATDDTFSHQCKYVSALEAATLLRGLLKEPPPAFMMQQPGQPPPQFQPGMPGDPNAPGARRRPGAPDPRFTQVQVVIDEPTNTVFVTGPAEKVEAAKPIIEKLDRPSFEGQKPRIIGGQPTMVLYDVPSGTAESAVALLTKRYTESQTTNVRASGTDRVMVVALPADHLDVAAILKPQAESAPASIVKFLEVDGLDLTKTEESLRTLLGGGGLAIEKKTDGPAPGLLLRGSPAQIKEAIEIIKASGGTIGDEASSGGGSALNSGKTRTITIEKGNTTAVAEGLAELIRGLRPNTPVKLTVPGQPAQDVKPKPKANPKAPPPRRVPAPGDQSSAAPAALDPKFVLAQAQSEAPAEDAPITITVVGNKIYLTSDDPQTLALATQLSRALLNSTGEEINEVIRLRYGSAEEAAKVINEVFNGAAGTAAPAGGGRRGGFSPFNLFGLGGDSSPVASPTAGRVRVVAEKASNSLIVVKASPADLLQIRSLLARAIDYDGPPAGGVLQTRTIRLDFASATDVKTAVDQVFRNKVGSGAQQQQSFNPFGPPPSAPSTAELSTYADEASNQLIVNSTEPVYQEVLALCEELDRSTEGTVGVARVITLQGISSAQAKTAIEALIGKPEAEPENPFARFFGFGGSNNRNRGGRNRNRSSLDRPVPGWPGVGWPNLGGRDFFDYRGKDAPLEARLIFDPEAPAEPAPAPADLLRVSYQDFAQLPPPAKQPPPPLKDEQGTVANESAVQPPPAGRIEVVPIEGSNTIILRGPDDRTLDELVRFLNVLKQKTADSEIEVRTVTLKYTDTTVLVAELVKFYQRFQIQNGRTTIIPPPEQGFSFFTGPIEAPVTTSGDLILFPVARFNQIILAAPKANIEQLLEQIRVFDQPNSPDLKPVVYKLQKASAQVVRSQLNSFFTARFPGQGLSSAVYVTADIASNSLVVQATPGDQKDIADLIKILDSSTSGAVAEVEVIRLKNAFAAELAQVINQALNVSVVDPRQQQQQLGGGQGTVVQGGFGGVVFGGGGQGGQQQQQQQQQQQPGQFGGALGSLTGLTTKSITLQLIGKRGSGGLPVQSGAIEDTHVLPVERVNGLLVIAPTQTMNLLKALIAELDVVAAAQSNVNVFTLQKADALQVANLLTQLFRADALGGAQGGLGGQQGGFGGQQGGLGGQAGGFGGLGGAQGSGAITRPLLTLTGNPSDGANLIGLRIAPDTRTNTIIVAGSRNDLATINAIIARLEAADAPTIVPQVYKLRNAAAADVAEAVTNFVNSQFQLIASQAGQANTFLTLQRNLVVAAEPVSNNLLISATPQLSGDIGRLIAQLDATPPQVLVHVLIAEVTLNNQEEFGVELGLQSPVFFARSSAAPGIPGTPGFNFNTTAPLPNASSAIPGLVGFQGLGNLGVGRAGQGGVGGFVFSAASDTVSVLIRALKVQNRIDILSRPSLLLTDNQQGFFQVGQSFPYVAGTNLVAGGLAQQNVLYREIGVVLRVVPRISPEGRVLMRVEPQVSSVAPGLISLGEGINAPVFNVQTLQTTVNAGDGETVILGGLLSKSDTKIENKIPVLGDIPYIGAAFRYRTQTLQRRELIFILTPHIIRNELDHARLTAIEASKMHWNPNDVLGLHTYGADVLAPRGPAWCNPETLEHPVAFPYNSPGLECPPLAPNVVGPDGLPVVLPSLPVNSQPAGFPLVNATTGTPTVFAPPPNPTNPTPPPPPPQPVSAPSPTHQPTDGTNTWGVLGK